MPSEPLRVSAIIPVYNGAAFLAEAIESILKQAYAPLDLIVVDDGSTDATAEIAAGFGPAVRYFYQPNAGPPAARNRGLKAATGDMVAFLDADDLWSKDKLAVQLARLAADPAAQIAVGRRQMIRPARAIDGGPAFEEFAEPLVDLNLGSALFRKAVFEKVGRFDETLKHCDDWDWFMRARELGVPMSIGDEIALFYRRHDRNITNQKDIGDYYLARMLKKSLDRRRARGNGAANSLPLLSEHAGAPMNLSRGAADRRENPSMNRPLVSAIVPVYNGERFLAAALDSIFAQSYRPVEAIIVDDGSTDRTADIARSYAEARYIYQPNQGHAAAKNAGAAAAAGDFLAFLDADDLWTPDKLFVQVAYLLDHPEIDYVIARMRNFLEPGVEPPLLAKNFLAADSAGFVVGTLLVRRAVFNAVGGFDTTYRHGNDTDWFFRAKEAGVRMTMLPHVLLRRRFHGANLSYETRAMASDFLRAVKLSIDRTRGRR
jgi:glycosyltransferase involved in cell wall biosynthesis